MCQCSDAVIVGTRCGANVFCPLPVLQMRGKATLPVSRLRVVASVWAELAEPWFCGAFSFIFFITYRETFFHV